MIGGFQVGPFQPIPAYQQAAQTPVVGGSGAWWKGKRKYEFYRHEPMLETLSDVYRLIEEERVEEENKVIARQEKYREESQRAQKAAENAARLAKEAANYIRSQLAKDDLRPPAMPKVQRVDTEKFWAFVHDLEETIKKRQQKQIDDDDDDIIDILNMIK